MPDREVFVLDTSALLALRSDEPGAARVEALLSKAKNNGCLLFISFITRMEILYLVWREEGEEAAREALRLIDSFSVQWVSCDAEILDIASRLKAKGGLSLADSWIGATTIARGARLIHRDAEFSKLKEIPQELLGK